MKTFLAIIVLVLFVNGVYASEEKDKLSLELLELSYTQQTLDATIKSYVEQLHQAIPGMSKDEIDTYFQMAMGWEVLKPSLIRTAGEIYSEDELKGVIEFLKTPVGKAYSKKSPEFGEEFSKIVMKNVQKSAQYLQNQARARQKQPQQTQGN